MGDRIYVTRTRFSLTAAVISKPGHFLAVTKLKEKFYNLDNLDSDDGKKGYSTFKEALGKREQKNKEELVHLGKRSDDRRSGAVQYLIYVAEKQVEGLLFQSQP